CTIRTRMRRGAAGGCIPALLPRPRLPAIHARQPGAAVRSAPFFAFLNVRPLAHPPGYP
ncbi:MAG: hypothetical protein AVDCRST_MAG56-5531, partial [uncultured Cytophagales bacterium]